VTFIVSDGALADTEIVAITVGQSNLAPVLASLADESGLASLVCDDDENTSLEKYGSTWVFLARKE